MWPPCHNRPQPAAPLFCQRILLPAMCSPMVVALQKNFVSDHKWLQTLNPKKHDKKACFSFSQQAARKTHTPQHTRWLGYTSWLGTRHSSGHAHTSSAAPTRSVAPTASPPVPAQRVCSTLEKHLARTTVRHQQHYGGGPPLASPASGAALSAAAPHPCDACAPGCVVRQWCAAARAWPYFVGSATAWLSCSAGQQARVTLC